jgi:tRNA wybutosine-synthesizing protein 3
MFDKQKKQVLERKDKSVKGSIDKPIRKLVDLVNSLDDYYTTSSCSGRIFLIERTESGKKNESKWLLVKHAKISFNEVKKALISNKKVWFKQESMIIHFCCRDIEAATKMLDVCREAGLKRAGISTIGRKIMIEAFGTERIDTIVAEKGKILVSDDYLNILVREANKKHSKNIERIKRLEKEIKKLFLN